MMNKGLNDHQVIQRLTDLREIKDNSVGSIG